MDDALSRKSFNSVATLITSKKPLLEDIKQMELQVVLQGTSVSLASLVV